MDNRLEPIIDEPKLKMSDFLNYLKTSSLAEVCSINTDEIPLEQDSSKFVINICKSLEKLINEDLTYDQLTTVLVASSMTYLVSSNFKDFECRTELLHKTFRYTNTLDPVNLHIAAKRLHENIKPNENLLFLCKNICFSSDMGNALSMCLVWAMLLETLNVEIEMYCFHTFSYISELLADVDINQMLKANETTLKAHFLFQLISFLVSSLISRSNEEFKKAGYSQYFRYEVEDIKTLREWARNVTQNIVVSIDNSNTNYDLIMEIKETIAFTIISPLNDKLATIDGGQDHLGLAHSFNII